MSAGVIDWQTVRPVTPADKVYGYVQIPAFTVNGITWEGASTIVRQYNVSASKNFILRSRPAKPTGANFVMCIRYRVGDVVTRYKLWNDDALILSDDAARLYDRNLIKKNFVIEIWSLQNQPTASSASTITLNLSIQHAVSDMFTTPANFVDATGAAKSLADLSLLLEPDYPLPTADMLFRYCGESLPAAGNVVTQWIDQGGSNFHLTGGSPTVVEELDVDFTNARAFRLLSFDGVDDYLASALFTNVAAFTIYIAFRQTTWTLNEAVFTFNNRLTAGNFSLAQSPVTPQLRFNRVQGAVGDFAGAPGIDIWTACVVDPVTVSLYGYLYPWEPSLGSYTTALGPINRVLLATSSLLSTFANVKIAELVGYGVVHSAAQKDTVLHYLAARYGYGSYGAGAAALPMSFGEASAWKDNT